jgi:hypothetical protein
MLKLEEALDQFRGRIVVNIEVNEFRFEDQKEPIGIIFSFGDGGVLSIRLNGDGTGFILEAQSPEKLDLNEFGYTTEMNWVDQFGDEIRLPSSLHDIVEVAKPHDAFTGCSELTVLLSNARKISLQNCGDHLKIGLR